MVSGHINGPAIDHVCDDDIHAVRHGRSMLDGHDIEVWQGTRVVAYLVPDARAIAYPVPDVDDSIDAA